MKKPSKKTPKKKLEIQKETVKELTDKELDAVAGGTGACASVGVYVSSVPSGGAAGTSNYNYSYNYNFNFIKKY
jgi:bacteriocin-like protein